MWRIFKRGFTWGFMLTTVVMAQYTVAMYLIRGAALTQAGRNPMMFLIQPLAYGVLCGTGFGVYENVCYSQIKH